MVGFHHKYGQCEQCGLLIEVLGTLQSIHFWTKHSWENDDESNKHPYYLYVCDSCFNSRNEWCLTLFPENCEKCNEIIEEGEYYTNAEKEVICIDCKG